MTDQEIITAEEADEEAQWYQRLRNLEQVIFDNRTDELNCRFNQLSVIWEIVTNGYYRNYNSQNDDAEGTLAEWFEYLRNTGGVPISYPSWREIHKTVVAALSEDKPLEIALKAACVAPRLASILEDNNVLRITAPDGDRQLPTGETVKIEYGDNASVLNGNTFGEYVERISEMPSSRHAAETIRHDVGNAIVVVKSMWNDAVVSDVEFRDYYGEMEVQDTQGNTPFQFKFSVEASMPNSAQKIAVGKLSRRYKFLVTEKAPKT